MSGREFLLLFDSWTEQSELDRWLEHLAEHGANARSFPLGDTPIIATSTVEPAPTHLQQPTQTVVTAGELRLARRELRPEGTIVDIGTASVGDGAIAVFAGPCAVEHQEQMLATADAAADAGAIGLRGGAFKPRTSPYSFQGLGWDGLDLLTEARERTGLPVLTEVVDPRHVERFAGAIDAFQIGTRNMQNFALLSEVGKSGLPVVLKRGFGCTIDELLKAGEYILAEGNDRLIFCERGIRTFDRATRFTLDLSAAALLKQRTHLPVMVDPSHAVGMSSLVEPMTLAAAATGIDAILLDIHVNPDEALCDAKQALWPAEFHRLMNRLDGLAMGLGRKVAARVTNTD